MTINERAEKLAPSALFTYTDSAGIERVGYVEKTSDHGGADVTYFMRRWAYGEPGQLDVLSGLRAKDMRSLGTR